MDDIYIPLTMHMDPEYRKYCKLEESGEKIFGHPLKAEELVKLDEKVSVILGAPGM
jgi:hypothetical protein